MKESGGAGLSSNLRIVKKIVNHRRKLTKSLLTLLMALFKLHAKAMDLFGDIKLITFMATFAILG